MDLSIIVPVLNEEASVGELYQRIVRALEGSPYRFEVLFVDDGSTDGTVPLLRSLQAADPRLRIIKFRKNCGQTAAMRAGIDHAAGRILVTMDGDLQNDPEDICRLAEKVEAGFDLVAGWRRDRKDPFLTRKLPSRAANWIISKVTGVPIHDNGCSLKAYRAATIKQTPLYSELHRFIPAMVSVAGGKIAEVVVRHHKRRGGTSKYGLSRIGKVFLDIITVKMLHAFSERPLHWFGLLAVPSLLASASFALLALVGAAVSVESGPNLVDALSALLCANLAAHCLVVGLLGELIVKTGKRYEYRSASRFVPR
jgi:glycosyltransferase involved in cell wall biosynthesis